MLAIVFAACSSSAARRALPPPTTSTSVPVPTPPTTAAPTTTTEPGPGQCPTVPPRAQPRADRTIYHLTVNVDAAHNTVTGTVDAKFTPDLATDRLVFRLWPNGPVLSGAGAHLQAGQVVVDGTPAASQLANPTTLVVPHPVAAAQTVDVSLPWTLTLPGPIGDRISRTGDSVRLGSFFPILSWEPGVGWATEPPTVVHAETATTPAADFTAIITVPAGFQVLATGAPDGTGTWSAPGVGDFAMTVGHFTEISGTVDVPNRVVVTVGMQQGIKEDPKPYFDKILKVLQQYSQRFGPYPWPAYTMAVSPELSGGIEYPMHVMQGPNTLGRSTAHELGHQWFYGLVENNQARDPWLDEGLASWAEGGFEQTLPAMVADDIPPEAVGQAGQPMTFWDKRLGAYFTGVYHAVPHALSELGPPALVDCALAAYVAMYAYRVARPANLIGVLTKVFPSAPASLAKYGLRADR